MFENSLQQYKKENDEILEPIIDSDSIFVQIGGQAAVDIFEDAILLKIDELDASNLQSMLNLDEVLTFVFEIILKIFKN